MEENQSLEGVVEYLIFENEDNGYVVFSVNTGSELVEAAGAVGEVHIGETVKLEGRFETHPTYGRQFKATSCASSVPQAVQDIKAYLASGHCPTSARLRQRRRGNVWLRCPGHHC